VGAELAFTSYSNALAPGAVVPALVAFDPLGRVATASPANIARIDMRNPALGTGERRLSIRVDTNGQTRLCDPSIALSSNPQGCV
jgi:type IV fimbrial biogenesis protein FimT